MTVKKTIAIGVIFIFTLIAWMILGATNSSRTRSSFYSLKKEVARLYGDKVIIKAPECYKKEIKIKEKTVDNKIIKEKYNKYTQYDITKSDISIIINLDQRKKGNLWFPTFKAKFSANYIFSIKNYEG